MPDLPSFAEKLSSQIPAVQLLMALGYNYLPPERALRLRGGRRNAVVLDGILEPWLRENNAITYQGRQYAFVQANIRAAIRTLTSEPLGQGLLPANERVYELLTLGTSLAQTIEGDSKSHSLHYVDWQRPERNVYHITDEFPVQRPGSHETRRPDIVLFINGIPMVVIE